MLLVAGIALVISILLCAAAVVSFWRSATVARWLMICANGAAILGVLELVLAHELNGVAEWAFLFACGACGCGVVAVRKLNLRAERWAHRFVIYAGYEATFAAMSTAGLWLTARAASGKLAAAVFIGVYLAGSACVFLAKTLTVRIAAKTR
jgi:hypothetical protein